MAKEIAALQGELEKARRATRGKDRGASAALSKEIAEKTQALDDARTALEKCRADVGAAEAQRGKADADAKAAIGSLAAAQQKNERLYAVGKEMADWVARDGAGLGSCDPFFGLKRVELEKTAQDYQDKLLEERLKP
jgi:hypothetical protein